jgi:hypothetical protein
MEIAMTAIGRILTGAAGLALAAGAFASPAAAQYYPNPYGNGGVLGTIINGVLGGGLGGYGGYGQYGGYANQQAQVDQCARAAEQRVSGYSYGGYNNGYNNGYAGYNQSRARVVGITSVERKSGSDLRVRGLLSTGGYAGYNGYNNGYNAQADLRFSCRVDARGYVRDLDINRNTSAYYRGY